MPDIPEEAVQAATAAIRNLSCEHEGFCFECEAHAALEAAAPTLAAQVRQQVMEEILTRLRRLAAGRREYAKGAPAEMRHLLLCEADVLDAAVKVANGSKLTMMGLIPTWWWGDDEGQAARQAGDAG